MVGWRIAAVQIVTFGLLIFCGLGFYCTALKVNKKRGLREMIGLLKRFIKHKEKNDD